VQKVHFKRATAFMMLEQKRLAQKTVKIVHQEVSQYSIFLVIKKKNHKI
jgi:hypothetical protein